MKFYTSIAPYYDSIFPFKPPQKDFVLSFLEGGRGGSLLDIGCGTGGLITELQDHFHKLTGIDPDPEMLQQAKNSVWKGLVPFRDGTGNILVPFSDKNPINQDVELYPFGMLDIEQEFGPDSFDMILCFGNTLVHLGSVEEVEDFFNQSSKVLKPGGRLLGQIINYDRILDQGLKGLPTIENDHIRFERIYEYAEGDIRIKFKTKLLLKSSGLKIENEVPLLALRPGRLREILEGSGFRLEAEYGSFAKEAFGEDSGPYVFSVVSKS